MNPEVETLIVGAGPGGLQLGHELDQRGRDYLVLEAANGPGAFFRTQPRHRKLLSINKRFCGYDDPEIKLRWDWNSLLDGAAGPTMADYSTDYFPSADDLVRYLEDWAAHTEVNVRYEAHVEQVRRGHDAFHLTLASGEELRGERLVVATGLWQMNVPAIPGIELAEPYDRVSVRAEDFEDERVLIIGKGNSAFETGDHLLDVARCIHLVSPSPVELAWQTHYVGDLRAVNNQLIDTYQLKSQNALLNADLRSIQRTSTGALQATFAYTRAMGEVETLEYDRVINCTGFRFDTGLFAPDCVPELTPSGRLPLMTSAWESTNVPGLYFAGTITQSRDYHQTTSAFIHGFRYNSRALARILDVRHDAGRWPERHVPAHAEAIQSAILDRLNRTSSLWHQFGFLCDVVLLPSDDGPAPAQARYLEDVPVDWASESGLLGRADAYVVTLEYGPEAHSEPLTRARVHRESTDQADQSQFLHPIIRHYSEGVLQGEHHIIEDLISEWREEIHTRPLLEWLARTSP